MLLYSTQSQTGWVGPDFTLPSAKGDDYHFYTHHPKKGLVVFFTCNHCPYAIAAWPLLIDLYHKYNKKGFEFIAINSNDEKAYPDDSFEEMKNKAGEWSIPFPYLRDESQEIAKKYQAQCTPDVYVFDSQKKLFYRGRVNDNWKEPEKATRNDLDESLKRILIGDKPPVEQFPSMGCSIKWKE